MNATDLFNWWRRKAKQAVIEDKLSALFPKAELIYTKRWVIDPKKTPMPLNVCDFLRPSKTLVSSKALILSNIWTENITYVKDDYAYNGALDVWQFPEETKVLGKGDCDDSGAFRIAKAKSNGLGDDLFACLGFYGNVGHFFSVRIREDKLPEFVDAVTIIENTSNQYTPISYKGSQYDIHWIFNENQVWKVKAGASLFGKKILKEFGVIVCD